MEEIISTHPDIAECAVVGVEDSLKGQVPVGFAVMKAGKDRKPEDVQKEVVGMIRSELGAIACLNRVCVIPRLPKTRSGKVLRSTIRKIADSKPYTIPSTIEDPEVLKEIDRALKDIGYAK